ncbi:hypothetical protein [Novosphingobium sp.]|uniref:hypothetical protein n=1 Tax=Novosphingobium sp. TaxID=1874826 RepID=UPI0028A9D53F|nr:hypothetical protein [Novosphingobium sp.]
MSQGAFLSDEGLRAILLADLDAQGLGKAEWPRRAIEGDDPQSGRTGFHPAFTALVCELASDRRPESAQAFVAALLTALPLGADTADLVRRWFVHSWDASAVAIAEGLGEEARHLAQPVVDLIEKSRHEPVPGKAWRTLRGSLARNAQTDVRSADYLQIPLAMAWDLDQIPNAVSDAVAAWSSAIMKETNRETGWTGEVSLEANALSHGFYEKAAAEVQGIEDREVLIRSLNTLVEKYKSESPRALELAAKYEVCWAKVEERRQAWLDSARSDLVALASEGIAHLQNTGESS